MPVDAKLGITTGVSAHDRVKTIQAMMKKNAKPEDLARPGHLYPLLAQPGGVLTRPGHTEGAVDLVRLAGFKPAAVLCELMNKDGTMTRGKKLKQFAQKHRIPIVSIAELVKYRFIQEDQIKEQANTTIHLADYGKFQVTVFHEKYFSREHMMLYKRPTDPKKPLLVRVHSSCTTGDIFHSTRCDCYAQLHHALEKISVEGGALIYLDQEGRGIGLLNKIKAYQLQDQGFDTVEANIKLGLPIDHRKYYMAIHILKKLKAKQLRVLTNNPDKMLALSKVFTCTREAIPIFCHPHNQDYLRVKKTRLKHFIAFEKEHSRGVQS